MTSTHARAAREPAHPGAGGRLLRDADLVWQMVATDLRTRYVGSLLGFAWHFAHPLLLVAVYALVFSKLLGGRVRPDGGPYDYGLYLTAGLIPWFGFQEIVSRSTGIFREQAKLVKNVAFPPVFLHAYVTAGAVVNSALFVAALALVFLALGHPPGAAMAVWPAFVLLQLLFATGVGLCTSVLNVFFRDVGPAVALGLQLWFWLTPIVYPLDAVPDRFAALLGLNPLLVFTRIDQGLVLRGAWPSGGDAALAAALVAIALAIGLAFLGAARHRILDEL